MRSWIRVSPRSKEDKEKIESGYDFEKILFGTILVDFSKTNGITDISKWNENKQLLTEKHIEIQKDKSKNIKQSFSGISIIKKAPSYR